MGSDFVVADEAAVDLANKALMLFDGYSAELALPALIVLVSEIVSQISTERKEVAMILLAITDSVFMNCSQTGRDARELN
jgi:hypothetical protein